MCANINMSLDYSDTFRTILSERIKISNNIQSDEHSVMIEYF
jgi:hypothetical protein